MSLHDRLSAFKSLVGSNVTAIRADGAASWGLINLAQREDAIVHDYLSGKSGGGLSYLNKTLSPRLAVLGFEVKFAGVFCHGHPQVQAMTGSTSTGARIALGNPCELADLHVVFTFLDRDKGLRDQRSLLIQAKRAPSNPSLITHPHQRTLYETAGGFDYTTVIIGSRYWPRNRDRERALHYLFCGLLPVTTSSACAPAIIDFGELLFRFLCDAEGLFFRKPSSGWPGWWNINWDLITHIAGKTYLGVERGHDIVDVLSHFNDFRDPTDFFLSGQEGGLPTLFVIVKDNELAPEK